MTSAWIPLLASGSNPMSHVEPHELFSVGGHAVSNHVVMLVVSALLLMIVLPLAARARGIVPSGLRNMVEAVLQFIREEVARPILGERTDRYMPMLWTFFFFILTANLLGMIPLGAMAAPLSAHLEHIGGTATANLSVTAGLALCAFAFIHVAGIREQGAGHYFKHFVPAVPWWLFPLFVLLEIIAALVKPFALAMRLFANMLAGHVVLTVLIGFGAAGLALGGAFLGVTAASLLGAVALSLLELFVAFLQAYVFTFLTTLFVGMAVQPEH